MMYTITFCRGEIGGDHQRSGETGWRLVATISRVLNSSPLVTEATKEHVRNIIEELDYHPNVVARSLRSSKSRLLLALVPNISNPFHAEIVHGTNRVVHAHDEDDLCGARAGRAMVISAHTTRC